MGLNKIITSSATTPRLAALTAALSLALTACSVKQETEQGRGLVNTGQADKEQNCIRQVRQVSTDAILAASEQGWDECFDHNRAGLFDAVLTEIDELASNGNIESKRLDDLLYYLRTYSYFGDREKLTDGQWGAFDAVLSKVSKMPGALGKSPQALRVQEHLLVSLYRYYYLDELTPELVKHSLLLSTLLQNFTLPSSSIEATEQSSREAQLQADYTLLELFRSVGFLAYEARRKDGIKQALVGEKAILDALVQYTRQLKQNDWRLVHGLWALANLHVLLPEDGQTELDKQVKDILFATGDLTKQQARKLFSQVYLVNSFRAQDNCDEEFNGLCHVSSLDEVLPIKHICSDTLFIRARGMSEQQLAQSCEKLINQESFFHSTLASRHQPVANDFNQSLRVVIFDNYSEYNRHGQLTFNINTNNGGMYIEGKPSAPDNQATFYSFQAFWQQPGFAVWNLNHEYVHYLDGRFVKYSGFGHFPSHLVWWSEGLAEYISKAETNTKVIKMLGKKAMSEWLGLADIFATTYQDSSERVYSWSYLAMRFIFSHYPDKGRQLAHFLKTDYFDGYQKLLEQMAEQHQQEFSQWLVSLRLPEAGKAGEIEAEAPPLKNKARYLYRYLYRDYLRPKHLPLTAKHNHMSNWG